MQSSHTREEREKDLQVGELAGQPIRSLRQQLSDNPVVLLQLNGSEVIRRICLQVDFGLFPMPPAIHDLSPPAYNVVGVPLQVFRC